MVVINSTMAANSHYGLEIRGGHSTTVRSNTISDSLMGIVVQDAASGVTVDDNNLSNLATHAIALRDGVTGGKITNNTVSDSVVGVYLREAAADVESNRISNISNHGVSALGAAEISVRSNIFSGSGPSAVDLKRAANASASNNTTNEWTVTKPFWQMLVSFFQPLTIVWTILALILVFTALRGRRLRRTIRHPYADQAPMSTFTDLDPLQIRPDSLGPADAQASPKHPEKPGAAGPLMTTEVRLARSGRPMPATWKRRSRDPALRRTVDHRRRHDCHRRHRRRRKHHPRRAHGAAAPSGSWIANQRPCGHRCGHSGSHRRSRGGRHRCGRQGHRGYRGHGPVRRARVRADVPGGVKK